MTPPSTPLADPGSVTRQPRVSPAGQAGLGLSLAASRGQAARWSPWGPHQCGDRAGGREQGWEGPGSRWDAGGGAGGI